MKTETIFLELDSGGDGAPPTELRVFPKGKFATKKGEFLFDEKAAATVMAEYQAHGVDKHIDYCHAGVSADARVTDKVAAAWYGLEVRDGELWATNVRWTPPGLDHVRNKQFRYLSPAFTVERESRRIVELINVALTNLPATRNQLPLVAAEADVSANEVPTMHNVIALALGMSADASETDVLARLSRNREALDEFVRLSGKDEPKAALGVVLGWKAQAERCAAAEARAVELEAAKTKERATALMDTATKELRLHPKDRAFAEQLASQSLEMLEGYLATLTPQPGAPKLAPAPAGSGERLSGEVLAACLEMGISEDEAHETYTFMRKSGLPAARG